MVRKLYNDRGRKLTKDEMAASYYAEFMYKCSCSHTQLIPYNVDKVICSHCGNYIYKSEKDKFKDKLLKELRKNNV